MKMTAFIVTFERGGFQSDYRVEAPNRASARLKTKDRFEGCSVIKVEKVHSPQEKALQEAVAQGNIQLGVQKSLQLGYSDLPLFQEDKQLKLF